MDATSKSSKTRRNVLVQRQKHRGISFVNITTTTTAKTACYTNSSSSGIRFKPQKKLQGRTPVKPITNSDTQAVQKGTHKKIAPKSCQDARVCGSVVVPYQDVIDIETNASFSFELIRHWTRANEMQNSYLPSPTGPVIADWALHRLPPDIPDVGKQCFHAYLFSCPIRQYPLEQLRIVAWQPLAMDQSRFERLMLQPLTLRCTLSMGALFLLMKNERAPHPGLASHSVNLCHLVNSLVGLRQRSLDETVVLIQSIASLALLASYLGLYNDWHIHLKGLEQLVNLSGGLEYLPTPVQLLIMKADLKGACETLTMPIIVSKSLQQNASNILPSCQRTSLLNAVETAIYNEKCSDYDDRLCDSIQSLAILVGTINYAHSQCGEIVLDPLDLMEEYHSIEYKLLTLPYPIQSHVTALGSHNYPSPLSIGSDRPPVDVQDIVQNAKTHIQTALRIAGIFYLRLVKGGPLESLHGSIHMLRTLLQHLERITDSPTHISSSTVHGYSRSALIWACLVADLMLWASINEGWKFHEHKWGSYVCHDFLAWVLDGDDVKTVTDRDLALCRILDLGNFRTGTRDPRTYIQRILAM